LYAAWRQRRGRREGCGEIPENHAGVIPGSLRPRKPGQLALQGAGDADDRADRPRRHDAVHPPRLQAGIRERLPDAGSCAAQGVTMTDVNARPVLLKLLRNAVAAAVCASALTACAVEPWVKPYERDRLA